MMINSNKFEVEIQPEINQAFITGLSSANNQPSSPIVFAKFSQKTLQSQQFSDLDDEQIKNFQFKSININDIHNTFHFQLNFELRRDDTSKNKNKNDEFLSIEYQELSGVEKVQRVYESISNEIENMDVLIDNMLQKQEIDFLAAYRGHMIKVQKEIVMFKKLLSEQQFKIKRDKTVATLQKSFTWFRDEALNLSKLYEKKKDQFYMNHLYFYQFKQVRVNNQILEDDREFLEEALRNTKRENLHMRETLRQQNDKMRNLLTIIRELQEQFKNQGNQVQQNANINDILSDVQEGLGDIDETLVNKKSRTRSKILKSMDNRSYKQMISPQVKERFDHTIDNQDLKQDGHEIFLNTQVEIKDSNQNARSFVISLLSKTKNLNQIESVSHKIQEFINSQTHRQNELVQSQNRQLQLQRQQIVQLKNELARSSQTNEFENIFRQCVNQVKSDSIKNSQKSQSRVRLKSAVQTERSSRDFNRTTTMISSNQNLKDDNISLSTAKRDDLKAHQKRQVLDLFLKNEFVFNNVYNQMFPQRYHFTPRDQNQTLSGENLSLDNMKFLSETTQDIISQPFILSPTRSSQSGIVNNNYNSTNTNFYVGQSQNNDQVLQSEPEPTSFRYAQIKSGKLMPRASFINEKQQLKLDQRINSGRDLRNFKVNQQIHLYNPSEQTLLNLKTTTAADSNSKVNQSRPFSSYNSTSNTQNLRVSKRFNQSKREVSASFNFSNKTEMKNRPQTNNLQKRTLLNRTLYDPSQL